MKKILFFVVLILAFCSAPVLAKDAFRGTVIATTLLDDAPTEVTSDGLDVSQFDKVAFWVTYNETQVALSISAVITLEISYDDTTYLSAKFFDFDGGATLQSSETISSDSTYYFYWNRDLAVRFARVKVVATNTDDDDTLLIGVNFSAQK